MHAADLLRILEWAKIDSAQGRAYYISYLFALRAPSETLELRRAFSDGRITEFIPQDEKKALIATRTYRQTTVMVIKFAYRKY